MTNTEKLSSRYVVNKVISENYLSDVVWFVSIINYKATADKKKA